MRILITAGPTREPIDSVRYISNRSSGQLGQSLVTAALAKGHQVTAIFGPVSDSLTLPPAARRIDVETSSEMYEAVMREFPSHDLLIMAAAVADYRPKTTAPQKLTRGGSMTLELEATQDIVAYAAATRQRHQRVIGFSLEAEGNIDRARAKLTRKHLDLIVFNPLQTMNSATIQAALLYAQGQVDPLPQMPKATFATVLVEKAAGLFGG